MLRPFTFFFPAGCDGSQIGGTCFEPGTTPFSRALSTKILNHLRVFGQQLVSDGSGVGGGCTATTYA
jgi:hypothetical protein